jgi:rhamnopyranosyl-N-acetylglucosaminyl-diphospho-decaprenol beta-1,3/1,4-galactofuranosyltransferase
VGVSRDCGFSKGWTDGRRGVREELLKVISSRSCTDKSRVAAVVVTYNREELLRECLQALLAQTRPLDEIIVIDNASTDGTNRMVPVEFPQAVYVRLAENIGGAGGFHEGMKLAYQEGHDWIWVMDDDAVPMYNALEELLKPDYFQRDVYALASAVLYPDGNICLCQRLFDPRTLKDQHVGLECYDKGYFEMDSTIFVGMLISRAVIDKIGLPLKEFFIYWDDTEYCLRIRNQGGKMLTIPQSKILHNNPRELLARQEVGHRDICRPALSWRDYYFIRNMLYTYKIYGQPTIGVYIRLLMSALRSQVAIVLFRSHKLVSSKILWLAVLDGLNGRLDKTFDPHG